MAHAGQEPLLDVSGFTLRYRVRHHTVTAIEGVGFQVSRGDRVVLLGPSGCGKSTLLKAVGGFLKPSAGSITLNGRQVEGPGPDRVMVFQEFDQLLPWKTVRENVAFGLIASRTLPKREANAFGSASIPPTGWNIVCCRSISSSEGTLFPKPPRISGQRSSGSLSTPA